MYNVDLQTEEYYYDLQVSINSLFQQFPRGDILREGCVPDSGGEQRLEHRVDDEHLLLLPGVGHQGDVSLQDPGVVEVEPGGPLGHPEWGVARHEAVESGLGAEAGLEHDPVDEVVEDEVLAPLAAVLGHGGVGGDEDGDLAAHVGRVQARPLQLKHELKQDCYFSILYYFQYLEKYLLILN